MTWWRKSILVMAVCAAHVAVIYAFNAAPLTPGSGAYGGPVTIHQRLTASLVVAESKAVPVPQPVTGPAAQPPGQTQSTPESPTPGKPVPDETGTAPALKIEDFLDAAAVDETAEPEDVFDAALVQSVPLRFTELEIELWIDSEGQTVRVLCFGPDCTEAATADLQQLLRQHFKPARKNGLPVASRKLIQVEPPPFSGF